jgi:hypothetical protein
MPGKRATQVACIEFIGRFIEARLFIEIEMTGVDSAVQEDPASAPAFVSREAKALLLESPDTAA